MSWGNEKLGKLCDKIGSGTTPRGGASVYIDHGIALVRSQNVYNSKFSDNGLVFVTDEVANKMRNVTLEANDILLNITGDSVARSCKVPVAILPARVNQHVAIIRTIQTKLNHGFLAHFLVSPKMQNVMLSLAGSGGTRKALTKGMIENFDIPLPDLLTQKRIAGVLSAYDDLIENNRRRIALLEEAARLLYREWFVHFRFPNHENTKFENGLPVGWDKKPLAEIASIIMGQSPESEFYNENGDGLPFHQGVTDYGVRFVSDRVFSRKITKLAEVGDILFSVRAPVGRLNYTLNKMILGRGLAALRTLDANQSHLFYALKNAFFKEDIIGGGSIFAATNKKELEKFELVYPDMGTLSDFNSIIGPLDEQIKTISLKNLTLAKARDLLLPRLMDGRITV